MPKRDAAKLAQTSKKGRNPAVSEDLHSRGVDTGVDTDLGLDVAPDPRDSPNIGLLTIGHSTRPIADFLALLKENGVARLIDIRTIPKSRFNPQFNQKALEAAVIAAGIEYLHMQELGGMRHARKDSVNQGWRNDAFRGYADYMQTPEFEAALTRLMEIAAQKPTAIMCAEAVPWRCHRSLVSDALLARGIHAEHIMSPGKRQKHEVTSFAKVKGTQVTYPPDQTSLALNADSDDAPTAKRSLSRRKQKKAS